MIIHFEGSAPRIPNSVLVCEGSYIIGDVEIGEDSSVWFGAVIRADVHKIRIGARVSVQDGAILHVTHHTLPDKSDGNPLIIGDDVTIGHRAILHGCTIDSRVLVGMGAIIMDDAKIGSDSIVGAGAVVTKGKSFPPKSLILGSPARFVRTLNSDEVREIEAHAHRYVEFQRRYKS